MCVCVWVCVWVWVCVCVCVYRPTSLCPESPGSGLSPFFFAPSLPWLSWQVLSDGEFGLGFLECVFREQVTWLDYSWRQSWSSDRITYFNRQNIQNIFVSCPNSLDIFIGRRDRRRQRGTVSLISSRGGFMPLHTDFTL